MKISGTGIPPVSGSNEPIKPVRDGRSGGEGTNQVPADGVELSSLSRALAQLSVMNDVREDLIQRVIQQLDQGDYLDGDKLRTAVLKMLNGG